MFVGHYAASLALKSVEKTASLGILFLAVQLVDIIFFPLAIAGIERINIIENYTASTHFELVFMPYTHSLAASFLWAGVVYAIIRFMPPRRDVKQRSFALVVAVGVLSHWFFDLIVHTPDLPLIGDHTLKLGFGLWNNAIATYMLEAVLLIAGLWLYLKSTKGHTRIGRFGMIGFVIFLLLVNFINIFGPLTDDRVTGFAVPALVSYFLFAGIAFWLDGKRA
jgi:hypothetical protein